MKKDLVCQEGIDHKIWCVLQILVREMCRAGWGIFFSALGVDDSMVFLQ